MRFKTSNYFPQCSQKGSPTSRLSFKHVCFACSGRFCIICLFQWATFGLLMSLFLRFFNVCICLYVLVDLSRAENPVNAPVAPLHWPHVSDVCSHFDDIVWQEFHVFSWSIESGLHSLWDLQNEAKTCSWTQTSTCFKSMNIMCK